jgi:lysine-specific demethylase 8/hypoxia-inducible factor 1-alpha inhibitor (HIF hydroxylase)
MRLARARICRDNILYRTGGAVLLVMLSMDRVSLESLTPGRFFGEFVEPSTAVVITGAIDGVGTSRYALEKFVDTLDRTTPLVARYYGQDHLESPDAWATLGYCREQMVVTAGQYEELLVYGAARAHDVYIVSDIGETRAGRSLAPQFDRLSRRTGFELSHFGPVITAWWGPPRHTEPLHCDIVDGTLWQLHGEKRVVLFPAQQWCNLYPFPFSSKMSWSFSQVSLKHPDTSRFPRLEEALHHKIELILTEGEILYIPAGWAHEITGVGDTKHVLSVNRFWKTSMLKLGFLPEDVIQNLVPEPMRTELLRRKRTPPRAA